MKTFNYKVRSLRDQAVRENQTRDQFDKSPTAEPTARCQKCTHFRWAHCSVRRSRETRDVLFVAKSRGEHFWQRVHSYSRFQSGYSAVKCRHASPDGAADFPLCNTSACAVRDCPCVSFQSPYKKPRVSKKATGAPKPRRKKADAAQFELALGRAV